MKTFDLGWGESVAVRAAFLETWPNPVIFDSHSMEHLGYPAHPGNPSLIDLTKEIIKRQIGNEYKHVLITNGATGGCAIALRSFALNKRLAPKICITRPAPYFRLYPEVIYAAGLEHHTTETYNVNNAVYLVDSLTNPHGTFSEIKHNKFKQPIVWDGVYYGNVYAPGIHPQPDHDVLVGSYSKLTGLNGLRVGWIATNNDEFYENMKRLVIAEYCGISAASTKIILDTVGQWGTFQWIMFEKNAQIKLDNNRSEFSKLERFFGGQPVSSYGMFYYAPMDVACKKLFEKSGIIWSAGSQLGASDDFGRFNVGQDVNLVKKAVATVLKNDKI